MSLISRMEVTNYLTEGINPHRRSADWKPMLTGITLRMDGGKSALVNITNGGGKTSLVELQLYLLSRDSRLLKRIREKVAPKNRGFTHARIEFRTPPDDNYLAPSVLEIDPLNMPGETQVIGVVLNDDINDNPIFYSYSGTLEDSPCYNFDGKSITSVPDGEFIARTKALRGCKWNKFTSRREWEDHIRLFLPIEVIRRNVIYQLKGSDDKNASFFDFTPRGGETYDSAFFRSVVAPDLLSNLLSTFSDEDESAVEDTLLKSLSAIVSAEQEILKKSERLRIREEGISKLQPILSAGKHAEGLKTQRDVAVRHLRRDLAFLSHFGLQGSAHTIPGIPRKPFTPPDQDKRIYTALKGMVISPDDGILLLDRALGDLLGIEVAKINEAANRKNLQAASSKTQVIDFACDFGFSTTGVAGGGHYRKGYPRESALAIPGITQGITGAYTEGLKEVLTLAFDIAETQIDTNPASHAVRSLLAQKRRLAYDIQTDGGVIEACNSTIVGLEAQLKDRQENQGAWDDFIKLGNLFPEAFRQEPLAAESWYQKRDQELSNEIADRGIRMGRLQDTWLNYVSVTEQYGLHGIDAAQVKHDDLIKQRDLFKTEGIRINREIQEANTALLASQKKIAPLTIAATNTKKAKEDFDGLVSGCEQFRAVFKDADPRTVDPLKDLEKATNALREKRLEIRLNTDDADDLRSLKNQSVAFNEIFGQDTDPAIYDPVAVQRSWMERESVARQSMAALSDQKEALEQFKDMHPGVEAEKWLATADQRREELQKQQRELQARRLEISKEIAAIEQMSAVEDGAFVKAWSVLAAQKYAAQRLHETVLSIDFPVDLRMNVLSALSGMLSAPVFESIEAMQVAADTLQKEGVSVPLLLKSALVRSLEQNIAVHGDMRLFEFIGGNYSRQVRILLDADYAKAELDRCNEALEDCDTALQRIALALPPVLSSSTEYKLASKAADAERNQVSQKYCAYEAEAQEAEAQVSKLAPQVTEAAREVLHCARQYIQRGGAARLAALDLALTQLKADLAPLEANEATAKERATQANLNARDAAVKYLAMGGEKVHQAAILAAEHAQDLKEIEEAKLQEIGDALSDLNSHKSALDKNAGLFEQEQKPLEIERLKRAIDFSKNVDDLNFMKNFEKDRSALLLEQDQLKPAAKIAFQRAEAFRSNQDKSDQDLHKEVAEKKQQAALLEQKITEARQVVDRLTNAEIPEWQKLARDIHELAYEIGSRVAQTKGIAAQAVELEEGAAPPEAHPSYAQTDALLRVLQEKNLACSGSLREQVGMVTQLIQEITVKEELTKHAQLQHQYQAAHEEYADLNFAFCEKARSAIGSTQVAFNSLEIEEISKATPSTMHALARLFDRLQETLNKEREDAQRAKLIAQETNEDSLNQLSRLITSAEDNLRILNKVMARYPEGRFFIETRVNKDEEVKAILDELKYEVERANQEANKRGTSLRRPNETQLKRILRDKLIECVFTNTSVNFVNAGIWSGKQSPVSEKLSTGQKIALEFMWIVRQAEYEIERGLTELSSKQAAKSRAQSNRVILIDGMFSTLSDRKIIKEALNGLRDLGGNFQIIGFLHSPTWTNDYSVFPIYHVGKKLSNNAGDSLVKFGEAGRVAGAVGFLSTITQASTESA